MSNPHLVQSVPLTEYLPHFMQSLAAGTWEGVPPGDVTWNATHHDFGMPRGIRYLKARRGHVNSELGLDGAWLPVTRTHTMQDGLQVGLWFHYMRGCSDFALEVGRTLLVRNKCEAAVLIEQRASNVTWALAVAHVHRKLSLAVQHASFGPALYHFIHGRKEPLNESTIWSDSDGQWALDRCARGYLHEVKSKSTSGELLNALLMSNALDYVTAAILMDTAVERGGQDHELIIDTIQFTNQCARMGDDCEGNVEIWDVRSLRYASLTSLRQVSMVREVRTRKARLTDDIRPSERERMQALRAVSRGRGSYASPPIFRWLNGSVCTLSPSWYQCVACAGSKTEEACRFACSDGRPWKDPSQRYQFIPNATGMYGGNFPAVEDKEFLAKAPVQPFEADVLGILTLRWVWGWGLVLGSVPHDTQLNVTTFHVHLQK